MKRIVSLMLLTGLCPLAVSAQEAEPGGVFFTLDFAQSLEASTDRDLTTEEAEDDFVSLTTFSFGAVTETRTERLSLDVGTSLRISDGEFSDDGLNATLAYRRISADAEFDISLRTERDDIAFLREIGDFTDDDGVITLPDDFEDLFGSGIRNETAFSTALLWGETAPVGYRLSASQRWLRYEDANASLVDSDTTTVGFGLRLNINEVTTGTVDLGYSQTDEEGSPLSENTSLSGALTFARPLGELTARLSTVRDEDGDVFWSAAVDQTFALPRGSLRGGLGVAQDEDGDPQLTGRLAFSFPQPTGQIDLSAVQALTAGGDSTDTTFRASYLQELSPLSSMRIGFAFAQASDTASSDRTATASLSASYSYDLAQDWQLSVGASFDFRDDDGTERDSTTFFVGLERPFSWRP